MRAGFRGPRGGHLPNQTTGAHTCPTSAALLGPGSSCSLQPTARIPSAKFPSPRGPVHAVCVTPSDFLRNTAGGSAEGDDSDPSPLFPITMVGGAAFPGPFQVFLKTTQCHLSMCSSETLSGSHASSPRPPSLTNIPVVVRRSVTRHLPV